MTEFAMNDVGVRKGEGFVLFELQVLTWTCDHFATYEWVISFCNDFQFIHSLDNISVSVRIIHIEFIVYIVNYRNYTNIMYVLYN